MNPEIQERIKQIREGKIPGGYKKTEAGLAPNEWITIPLSNLIDLKNGINAEKEKFGSGIKVISVLDILDTKPIVYETIRGKFQASEEQKKDFAVTYGDILFQRSSENYEDAGTSNVYLSKERNAIFSGFVIRGEKKSDYNPIYLNYLLKTFPVRKEIIRKAAGAQHVNISQESLGKVLLNYASKNEQRRIAEILSAQDHLIELKGKRLEEKKRQKKYLMQQLLTGKKRLPGFGEKWEQHKLKELSHYRTKHLQTSNMIYIGTENILPHFQNRITDVSPCSTAAGVFFKAGDILISNIRPYLKKIWIAKQDGICSPDVLVIAPDSLESKTLYYFLANDTSFAYISSGARGSKMPRGDKRHIMDMKLSIPPSPSERNSITTILSTADREIELLEQDLDAERKKKKALMQLLLTGIVRVDGVSSADGPSRDQCQPDTTTDDKR